MQTDREYVSPDGQLRFLVVTEEGDVSLGFADSPWHTHGDILAELSGVPIDEAVRAFVEALVGSQVTIAVSTINGTVRDIWVTDDPAEDARGCREPGEELGFRLWNGQVIEVADAQNAPSNA